ncbi:MAG: hypothetical protein ABR928_02785 [Terracidiphilus sp.]|jgi:hypothetical protein
MLSPLITSFVTSLCVSTLSALALRTYVAKRIRHHFDRELELYKAHLSLEKELRLELEMRRLRGYPRLVEIAYRTRNLTRDMTGSMPSQRAIKELVRRWKELEDEIYRERKHLEDDGLFNVIHQYKRILWRFYSQVEELMTHEPALTVSQMVSRLAIEFEAIEISYANVIASFTRSVEIDV